MIYRPTRTGVSEKHDVIPHDFRWNRWMPDHSLFPTCKLDIRPLSLTSKGTRPMKGLAFAVKALISALLLYLAFRLVNVSELQQRFYRLDAAWIVAAQTTLLAQI